jgi:hypothetical protein
VAARAQAAAAPQRSAAASSVAKSARRSASRSLQPAGGAGGVSSSWAPASGGDVQPGSPPLAIDVDDRVEAAARSPKVSSKAASKTS